MSILILAVPAALLASIFERPKPPRFWRPKPHTFD